MTRPARPVRDAGFTLIEIIAALIVFGLLIAGLAQGVRFGLTAWRLQTETVSRDADLDVADRLISSLLTVIQPVSATDAPSVIGTKSELAFTTALPVRIGDPPTNLADARLAVVSGRLTLDLVPHLHAIRTGRPPAPTHTVLASGVRAIEFGYWRRADGKWLTSWKAPQPPGLVRLTIDFAGDRHWAPIVAKPLLSRYDQ
jgi:general secretion pathway protein J